MKIKDIMSQQPHYLAETATIQEAAQKMAELDCGFMPIGSGDSLVGVVTDRDLAVRAVAKGLAADTPVAKIMTTNVWYCCETDSIDSVAKNMSEQQVRRLIVLNNKTDKRLVGIVATCDIANAGMANATTIQNLLRGVSQSNGPGSKKAA